MKNLKKSLLFILVLTLASCVRDYEDMYGTISGVVKDANTGNPLDNVSVIITSTGHSAMTEADGQFMFEDLEEQEYTLTFQKAGYLTTTQTVHVNAGENRNVQVVMYENLLGIEASPSFLDMGADQQSAQIVLTATGGKAVNFRTSSSASWLRVSPQSGSITATGTKTLLVQVTRTDAPGTYEGVVTITVNSQSMDIPVYMTIPGAAEPTITLDAINSITQTTAVVSGTLALEDGVKVSDYGVCFATGSNPTVNNQKISRGSSNKSASFECTLTGLTASTEYYVRPYAVADGTTYYGNERTFTTQNAGGGGSGDGLGSATVSSDNEMLDITFRSAKRSGSKVTVECLLTNNSGNVVNYLSFFYVGVSNSANQMTFIEDNLFTTYTYQNLTYTVGSQSGSSINVNLAPTTVQMKLVVTGVPADATSMNIHVAVNDYSYDKYIGSAYLEIKDIQL